MKEALLLIDIQNDYFPGGAMELTGSPEAGARAGELLAAFRTKGLPVIHIQHIAVRPGSTFFRPGTDGAMIHPCAAPRGGETVFLKHYPNAFRETPLLEHLRLHGIKRLVVAGMMTHMCVDTTVRAASDLGFDCLLAHDACATRALVFGDRTVPAENVQAAFIAALDGSFAAARTAAAVISSLEAAP